MATLRGIPNTPVKPQYVEEPKGWSNRAARKQVRAQNQLLEETYQNAAWLEKEAQKCFDKAIEDPSVKRQKGYVAELVAAQKTRLVMQRGGSFQFFPPNDQIDKARSNYRPYDNPTEYIADLWADGFIDDGKAQKLLGTLQEDGGVTPSGKNERVLRHQRAVDDIAATKKGEIPDDTQAKGGYVPPPLPPGSADKLEEKYRQEGVLIPTAEEVPVTEDTPADFLLAERRKRHISKAEFDMMLAWERVPQKPQSAEELAAFRKTVIQQMLTASPDMDKGEAALQALSIVRELRDPFAHELAKLEEDAARTQPPPKSVDIGTLRVVEPQGGFGDRELAKKRETQERPARNGR